MATSEGTIQSAVYHIELGRGKKILQWLLLFLGVVVVSLVYTAGQFRGLEKREAIDMAQLARNIARGQGFTTYVIRPLSMWRLTETGKSIDPETRQPTLMQHPDLCNPPLYPLALAALFKAMPPKVFAFDPKGDRIYGPERWVILPFDQICLWLSVLLVYLWARQLFDQRVAVTAGVLLLLSDTLYSYAVSGLPTNLLMLLLLLALYCLYLADRHLNPPEAPSADQPEAGQSQPVHPARAALLIVASAILLGLCFLTRYLSGFLIVPLAIYAARIMRGRQAGLWAAVYVFVFAAVIAPWLVRNFRASGSVLGIAQYEILGDEALPRQYHPKLDGAFSVRRTTSLFLTRARTLSLDSLKQIGSDYCIFFFLTGLMFRFRRRDVARLRLTVLGGLLCGIFGMALIGMQPEQNGPEVYGSNLLVLFLPLVVVFGVAFFYLLLDRIQFRVRLTRALAIGVFVLVNLMPIGFRLLPPSRPPYPYPPYIAPVTRTVAEWFGANEIGVSDLPWAMAWYGDRRTVWLPMTMKEFYELHDFAPPKGTSMPFLMLTPYMVDRPFQSEVIKGQYKDWATIVRGALPPDFPLRAVTLLPPDGDQFLVADRPRWPSPKAVEAQQPPTEEEKPSGSSLVTTPPAPGELPRQSP